jgi:hypothetical protein
MRFEFFAEDYCTFYRHRCTLRNVCGQAIVIGEALLHFERHVGFRVTRHAIGCGVVTWITLRS